MNARLFFKTIKGFLCMIGGCALIFILVNSFMNVYQRKNELADVKKQKEAIEEEREMLKNEIELLNEDDYVARYARENYVFTREGEQVSIIPEVK